MKKTFVMLLALVLIAGILALPVNAADSAVARVYLDAPAQAASGEEIGVSLYVNGNTASGGVQATISYNAAKLDYVSVSLRSDVTALGNNEDVTVKVDESTGTIRFVGLSNVAGGTAPSDAWATFKFTVKMSTANDSTDVTLSNVKVSDKAGVNLLDTTTVNTAVSVITIGVNDYVDMDGATIKTDISKQGLRFQATPDAATIGNLGNISEVGVVMMPADLLYEEQDLTADTIGKGGTTPAVARISSTVNADLLDDVQSGELVFATLTNGTTGGRANYKIVARAYVVVNGETIYSHNTISDKNIADGEAVKTLASVAQSIAAKEIAGGATETAEITAILAKDTLTDEEVTALLTFCRDNISKL